MTRLVRVRAICDGCSAAAATIFCVYLRNVFCDDCTCVPSRSNHSHSALSSAITALPFCEYCDAAPATVYCESEGATLCDKCNETVHKAAPFPHLRTPIQNTLRTRAVEFRSRSRSRARKRIAAPHINQQTSVQTSTNTSSRLDRNRQCSSSEDAYAPSSCVSKLNVASKTSPEKQKTNVGLQNRHSQPPLAQRTSETKSSALEAPEHSNNTSTKNPQSSKAKAQQPEPMHITRPENEPPGSHLFHTDNYNPFFDSRATPSKVHSTVNTFPFSSPPTEIAEAAKSLCEPLLITGEPSIHPLEPDPLAELDSCPLDLGNVMPCTSLDPSTDDSEHHVNLRTPPSSPYRPPNSAPSDHAVVNSSVSHPVGRNDNPNQSCKTAAVAAAVTAAAEMFLLNNAPHETASKEKERSLIEASRVVDAGGLAAAATAAAESAAAAVEMSILTSHPSSSEAEPRVRLPRHASEPVLPLRMAAQQHVFDEAMRRLDIDLVNHRIKDDMHVSNGKQLFGACDGTNHVLASIHDYISNEFGRRDVLDDSNIQKEEFTSFTSLPLSHFDQSHLSSFAFESEVEFCAPLDSEET
ncbi:unnamed protein product [Agarophyton chilense]